MKSSLLLKLYLRGFLRFTRGILRIYSGFLMVLQGVYKGLFGSCCVHTQSRRAAHLESGLDHILGRCLLDIVKGSPNQGAQPTPNPNSRVILWPTGQLSNIPPQTLLIWGITMLRFRKWCSGTIAPLKP